MGYQVGVTPLQMAAAVSVVANGGELVEPHVVRAFIRNGRREAVPRKVVRRAITPETAATMTEIMEAVVERGTAKGFAQIDGYTVAGKTGTASKLVNGHYSKSDYNASFVGFVPRASRPSRSSSSSTLRTRTAITARASRRRSSSASPRRRCGTWASARR